MDDLTRCPYCGIRAEEVCDSPPPDTCERALNTTIRPGTVRANLGGKLRAYSPHDALYSTATMVATEFWCEETKTWRPIWED